jgi:CheY-like chemotaxis protein
VHEIETMLGRLIGEGVRVVLDLDPDLRRIEADPTQVDQVLLNLAVNARDAMAGSGTLKIATRNRGDDVVLEVTDTGVGMDEETQARIFEPFFTTKGVGEGTGLGLSMVYGIVTQSGGSIRVRSADGHGATFVLTFPATAKEDDVEAAAGTAATRGGEHILVVDDEQVVRDLLAQLLRDQGYEVSLAASPDDARALKGPFDVLLTDIVMPGTSGPDLATEIDARHVLFMSGYDQDALVRADAPFLQKPFGRDDLAAAVRALLDGERVPAPTAV